MARLILAILFLGSGCTTAPLSTVTFFDVGQGDAAFVETQDGTQVLIDGGPDMFVLASLSRAMLPWDRSIDYVIATHPHGDHIVGLIEVLERYEVDTLVVSPSLHYSEANVALIDVAHLRGVNVVTDLEIDGFSLIFPTAESVVDVHGNPNEASVVVMFDDGAHKFLFMGDVGFEVENQLKLDEVDVLKVGHHGSKYSSSRAFLDMADPDWAVVSTGEGNRYGHPHPATMRRLETGGALIWRTDLEGGVMFRSYTGRLEVANH